jgi:hypothetical protein
MKVFLVLVISLAGKPPDAIVTNTFDFLAQCNLARQGTGGLAKKLVGTRKTDGTEVTGVSGVCVESTAADTRESIKARAIRNRQ